ncbi:hypothetical protein JQC91_09530 [Jannaschia sp. Os4]|uniref:hypothetical protein n=1 Tax=Jannaschia sp. Os4 TaxID=2807617 RepID=UPI00193A59CC|nr:hypothetical protein [Jannaschia sp. Os4]MBM2576548.1 hypothetical protein [Jannaschia sp. Os4]
MRTIAAITATALVLSGCGLGGSRLNPLNWFGGDREVRAAPTERAAPQIPLVDQVVSLQVDQAPGGAIVSTVGLPPTQGFWDAELVPVPSEDGSTYVLEFQLLPPPAPQPQGTQPSREVLAGTFLSDQTLAGVRRIAVQGARNQRVVSR